MEGILSFLQRFGVGRLTAILGVSVGVAAALAALVLHVGAQPEALLYSNLDLKEAASISQALDQAGIKYEAKGDGSTIMVARDKVASVRLMLASKGLPTSASVGYEIFDNTSALGQTDFVQNLNRQRALEGELARTIRSLDGVTFARVQLVLPKHELFQQDDSQPSASVVVGVQGREPSADQVRALQNLVAGAVPNLKPDRVTIVDQDARLLGGGDGEAAAGQAADDARTAAEERIRKQVKELVEGVVGPGRARVQVTADVDMSQVTTQEEKYDPDGQVARSTQTDEETAKQNQPDTSNQGASATANVPGTPGAPPAAASNTSDSGHTVETTNYEISKTTKTTVDAPGGIKKLSVAVAVDGVTAPGKNGKAGAWTPRSAEEMQHIEQLVRSAVGYDQSRGDQVSVINVRFDDSVSADAGATATSSLLNFDKNDLMRIAELVVLAAVAGMIIFFVARPLLAATGGGGGAFPAMRAIGRRGGDSGDGAVAQIGVDPQTGEALALAGPQGGHEVEQRIDIAKIEGQVKTSSVKSVAEFVEKHPEESVSILRSWLHEA